MKLCIFLPALDVFLFLLTHQICSLCKTSCAKGRTP